MLIFTTFSQNADSIKSTVDDALFKKIAEGDMEAFHTLYETANPAVYGFALSILKNTHDAQDVLQDTFLTVYKNIGSYIPSGKPMAWVLTIARNFSLMRLRDRKNKPIAHEFIIETEEAINHLEKFEERDAIRGLLEVLDEEEREIVMLRCAAGFKNREIAELLDLKLSTVLSKYHRAIKKLEQRALREETK